MIRASTLLLAGLYGGAVILGVGTASGVLALQIVGGLLLGVPMIYLLRDW